MVTMTYADLNYQAIRGTADNLVKLLKAYGHDDRAVHEIQQGVDYSTKEREKKDSILADFRAHTGIFAPAQSPGNSELTEMRKLIVELTKRVTALEKRVEVPARPASLPVESPKAPPRNGAPPSPNQ